MALRYDTQEIGELTRTASGGLKVGAFLTRTGVFEYLNADGTKRREYRPASEVFAPRVIDALKGSTLTANHPAEGRVDAENFARLTTGHVGDDVHTHEDGARMAATVYVNDAATIAAVERGDLREISLGYHVDYDPTPGTTPEGEPYDGVQRNIRPNHTALVPRGRAGRDVGLRLDHAGDQVPAGVHKVKITIAGKEYEAGSPEAAAALDALQKRLDAADAQLAEFAKERSARLRAEIKRLVPGVTLRADADDQGVMVDALKKMAPGVKVDGMSPDYVAGAFAVALANLMEQAGKAGAADPRGIRPSPRIRPARPRTCAPIERSTTIARTPTRTISPSQRARQNMIKRGASLGKKE